MPLVHCDTDELREFAATLTQFRQDTSDKLVHFRQWLEDVGQNAWTDENFTLYQDRFTRAYEGLQRLLVDEVDAQFLPRLAQLAQRYDDAIDR